MSAHEKGSGWVLRTQRESSDETRGALMLGLIGCTGLTVVRADAAWVPALPVVQVMVTFVSVLLLARYFKLHPERETRGMLALVLSLMTLAVWVFHYGALWWWDRSEPVETLLLACMQQTSLALAAFPGKARWGRVSVAISGFLMVFTAAIADHPWVVVTAIVYVIAAVWWWMGEYWNRTAPGMRASVSKPLRWWRIGAIVSVLGLFLAANAFAPSQAWRTLDGFMPTSGGNQGGDPNARRGVGAGDLLVGARDQAQTFGAVDTDVFLESDQPTLYDMFNDQYGEPKKPKRMQRAVALSGEIVQQNHQRLATSTEAGDSFSTDREASRKQKLEEPPNGDDVLQVSGATPLHLVVEHFDTFDGITWTRSKTLEQDTSSSRSSELAGSSGEGSTKDAPRKRPTVSLQWRFGEPWLRSSTFADADWLVSGRQHAIRVFRFSTARLPLPPHPQAWHVDRVDRSDLFTHLEDDHVVFADREAIPPLTVIEFASSGHRPRALLAESWGDGLTDPPSGDESFEGEQAVAKLAQSMAGSAPRGWRQIRTWVDGLRGWGRLAPAGEIDSSKQTPLSQFLETGEGPDYLFATTAALGLRALGYESRVASGFYVRPERFDRKLGYTRVLPDDLHFWCEVRAASGMWIPLEPSPGYAESAEIFTFWDRVAAGVEDLGRWLMLHVIEVVVLLLVIAGIGWKRVPLADGVIRLIGFGQILWSRSGPASCVIRLLERRAVLAGSRRPCHVPLRRWYRGMALENVEAKGERPSVDDWNRAWSLLDRTLYGNDSGLTQDERAVLQRVGRWLCRLPLQSFQAAATEGRSAQREATQVWRGSRFRMAMLGR